MPRPKTARDRILDAAEELFADHGFVATRVDAIAARAHINKRMLYYYFGDKRGLYSAVASANFKRVFDRVYEAAYSGLGKGDPSGTLRRVLQEYFDALERNPRYVRFMAWEAASSFSSLNAVQPHAVDEMRDVMMRLLIEGIEAGVFACDIDPVRTWPHVTSGIIFYFMWRPRGQLYFEEDLSSAESLDRVRGNLVTLVLRSVGCFEEGVAASDRR